MNGGDRHHRAQAARLGGAGPNCQTQFETDLEPKTLMPRIRFNFDNGWSVSLLIRAGRDGCDAMLASVAACPTGEWGTGQTELGESEAFADEAVAWIDAIRRRPAR